MAHVILDAGSAFRTVDDAWRLLGIVRIERAAADDAG